MAGRAEVAAGPLVVGIERDGLGRLQRVTLPAQIPRGLTMAHLAGVISRLGEFDFALDDAPPFHRRVWRELRAIPWGATRTYGEIAAAAGSPRASRAVGQACAANRLALVIPCHRVVGSAGPGGFAWGPEWKVRLLQLESQP